MLGYAFNTTLSIFAFHDVVPTPELFAWATFAYGMSGIVGWRMLRKRPSMRQQSRSTLRSGRSALVFAVLLALPWSLLATSYVGTVDPLSEVVLITLAVGMAASGSILLAAMPAAAVIYMSTILIPLIVKSFLVLQGRYYFLLGGLAVSYWVFLWALIATKARLLFERSRTVAQLQESVADLQQARAEIEHVAMTDGLTGLPNRRAFIGRLGALKFCEANSHGYGLFYLDLDRFKAINDALGHHIGDKLLNAVAGRLKNVVHAYDLVARIGGDEFAVITEDAPDRERAGVLAGRIITALAEPFLIDGHRIATGASIGLVLGSESDVAGEDLLSHADLAMYAAKSAKRGFCFFETYMQRNAEERLALQLGLRTAISNRSFELHYQPIRNLRTGSITSFEALIRWRHPTAGLLLPGHFLRAAEDLQLIDEIGAWVIQEACETAARWPSNARVAINLSPLQIASGNLLARIERELRSSGLPPQRLTIEITETSLLQNDSSIIGTLKLIKDLGVTIAMDDFGTGYSSLSYLLSFPFDCIKIDRVFVSKLGTAPQNDRLVASIVKLAKSIDCDVVAEGIESSQQLRHVRDAGASHGQGYLLGLPEPASVTMQLLRDEGGLQLGKAG